ncbi:MAG TPA: nickel ABC transporter permease [Candidatus Methylomirabilis sp.]|nr:nickel ABC transporter permease [Candidatus Methylomirabilis sp.]
MHRYILQRLLALLPVLFGVSLIVFSILKFVPGDPALQVGGLDASAEDLAAIRHQMGLDRPVHVQYLYFAGNALRGDFGRSIRSHRPVVEELWSRFPNTFVLTVAAMVIAVIVGTGLGVLAATRQYTLWDTLSMALAMMGISVPIFWLGLMLMLLFALQLRWLPTAGTGTPWHLILPSLTLGTASSAIIARQVRSAMLEVLRQDYVRTARAKGLRPGTVVLRHALKNAMIPAVTIIGLQFGYLLAGAVVTETVFAWPGVGRLLVDAIKFRDFPVVQATILWLAVIFCTVNLAVDLLYGYLDPRIKYR